MRVLLLNPSYSEQKLLTDPILTRCAGVPYKAPYLWPPVGLAYMASSVREFASAEVKIIDAQVDDFEVNMVKKFDLVAINSSTPTINRDIELSRNIMALNEPKVALMGVHAAYFHKEIAKYCDYVIRCEPDIVIPNLVKFLENKSRKSGPNGVTWRDKYGKLHINKDQKPIQNLDEMPFQAIDLLSKKYYDLLAKRNPVSFIITSRYCPFRCTFCSSKYYSHEYKHRSPRNIIEEIKLVLDYGFRDITFFDDSFTVNSKMVMELCSLLKKEKIEINWRCLSRVDQINLEMLQKMKKTGCYQIHLGVESGDQRILKLMKKDISMQQIRNVFKICDKIGIETIGSFVIGYPGETAESLERTFKLANEIKPDFVSYNLFTPLPGSEVFEKIPKKKWECYDFVSTSFCDIDSEKISEIIKEAYRIYYLNPNYILRRITKTKDPMRIIKQNIDFWLKRGGILWDFITNKS